ncbi:MAG: BF3164 family lipoprotein [Gemmatimonadota bacterium]
MSPTHRLFRFIGLTSIVLALGCKLPEAGPATVTDSAGLVRFSDASLHPVVLTGAPLLESDKIGRPGQMRLIGDLLWVSDRSGDPYIHVVATKRGSLLRSYGASGEGPGDFVSISMMSVRPGDLHGPWVFDGSVRRMTRLYADTVDSKPRIIAARFDGLSWIGIWLGANRLVSVGDLDTNRYTLFDTTGARIATVAGALPGADSVDIEARRNVGTGVLLCASPEAGRFATLYVGAGRIDILDTTATLVGHAAVPFPSDGEFRRSADGRWHSGDIWRHYADCAATPKYLYALFAGHRTDGSPGGGIPVLALHVHVFDWSGKLIEVLRLDRDASTLAVAGDSILYTGSEGKGLYRYRLPPVTAGGQ